ncbi:phosphatase PAP2 family protein [Arvimicrobium flavum]|uniref:phosphatase PAP2 family protein n=1 Tax=Arvimicrobium flavum TaxID=3393320 RepID=UPI00237ABDEC|nr:phosphatase PAP2 family protein [Mesorhizobium shangrilense]
MIPDVTKLVSGMKAAWPTRPLALMIALLAIGTLAFLYIAHEVGEASFEQLDARLLLMFRNPADLSDPIGPPWLAESVLEITALGGYTLIIAVMLAAIGLLVVARREGPALFVFLSIFSGWLMSSLLKSFYARPRPDLVPQLDLVHTASFPSGHATMSTVCYLTLAIVIARLTDNTRIRVYVVAVAILVSIAVGLSRVYLGVHWPSDVLAGWALGAAWAALSWLVVSLLRRRRKATTQEVERR